MSSPVATHAKSRIRRPSTDNEAEEKLSCGSSRATY
jgi:hypothetical protein